MEECLIIELSLGLGFSIVNHGLFEGSSQFSDFIVDGSESLSGEGGGEGDEGEDGVLTTDSVEFSKDDFSILFGLDGSELGGNNVEGFNDLGGVELSLLE